MQKISVDILGLAVKLTNHEYTREEIHAMFLEWKQSREKELTQDENRLAANKTDFKEKKDVAIQL